MASETFSVHPSKHHALITYDFSVVNSYYWKSRHQLYEASTWTELTELVASEVRGLSEGIFSSMREHAHPEEIAEHRLELNKMLDVLINTKDMTPARFSNIENVCSCSSLECDLQLSVIASGASDSFPLSALESLVASVDFHDYLIDWSYVDRFSQLVDRRENSMTDYEDLKSHLKKCKQHRDTYNLLKGCPPNDLNTNQVCIFINEVIAEIKERVRILHT
jgi:hypothetical protein